MKGSKNINEREHNKCKFIVEGFYGDENDVNIWYSDTRKEKIVCLENVTD